MLINKRQLEIFLPCINKACFIETGHMFHYRTFHIHNAHHNMANTMEKWNIEQILYENNTFFSKYTPQ